jgi:hypothetical protein
MTTHHFELTIETDADIAPEQLYVLVHQILLVGQGRAADIADDERRDDDEIADAKVVRDMQTTLLLVQPLPGSQEAYDEFQQLLNGAAQFTVFWMDELDRIRTNIACALQARLLTHEQSGKLLARAIEIHSSKLKGL